MSDKTPDGSTNLTDEQRAETADTADMQTDTTSGGAPDEPDTSDPAHTDSAHTDPDTTDQNGTPVENPSG